MRCKDGSSNDILFRNMRLPDGREVVTYEDVTQLRLNQQATLERERLKAAVETAGAACHELNQPLQGVLTQAELLLARSYPAADLQSRLGELLGQVNRMVEITQRQNRITAYRTTEYLGDHRILDLEQASPREPRD